MLRSPEAPIAVIGAGLSGVGCGLALAEAGMAALLLEKSRGVSGRAASRMRDGVVYDFGANFIDLATPGLDSLMARIPLDGLVYLPPLTGVFKQDGIVMNGDDLPRNRITFEAGINALAKRVHALSGVPLVSQTRIVRLEGSPKAWTLHDATGGVWGPFAHVVFTAPAPQTLELLETHPAMMPTNVLEGLREVQYQSQFSIVLVLDGDVKLPQRTAALLNIDRKHPIAWLSFEHKKRGHAPDGVSVLVAQMAPAWTKERYDTDAKQLYTEVLGLVSKLLGPLPSLLWADHQRWRYALPLSPLRDEVRAEAATKGLHLTGDSVLGKGRAGEALMAGYRLGVQLARQARVN